MQPDAKPAGLTSVASRIMKAHAPAKPDGRKALRSRDLRRRPRCRACPFRAPSGACLDPAIKSGRCGDWVWYVVGKKQRRRLWTKPGNPRTPRQQHWRDRFGAASKNYSQSLTDEQQDACIAAGAKVRSRPRLGDAGQLTGQQYSIRKEYAEKAKGRPKKAETAAEALQTQGILVSTPGPHRVHTVETRGEEGRMKGEGRMQKAAGGRRGLLHKCFNRS